MLRCSAADGFASAVVLQYKARAMRVIDRPGRATWLALFAGMALFSWSCQRERVPKPFADADQRAEATLRALGHSLFDVLSYRAEAHENRQLRDSFRRDTSLYLVRFTAEIRYTRDVKALSHQETIARLRQPDAMEKDIEQDIVLRRLLGVEPHPKGSIQELRNIVVFEEIESGWRLVAVDGPDLETH